MKIERDNFNSNIFKIQMGNVTILEEQFDNAAMFMAAEQDAGFDKFQHLTLRIPSNDIKTLNIALNAGYRLADTLIEYVFSFEKSKLTAMEHKCLLRDCVQEDLEALKSIAKHSFAIDRFHSDEHLSNDLCDLYYERWIENSYNGFAEKVIVAQYNNEPVGFTTGKTYKDDEYGHLVLSAVSSKYRGIGVYTSMIYEGVIWMMQSHPELTGLIVGTQLDNLAVQKAWIKLGFTVHGSKYVLQKYIEI